MREVVCINVGQAGIQMANATWELFCIEHGIEANGKLRYDVQETSFETFFQEVPCGNYVPRAISIDLEPSVLDEVRTASYRQLWHPDYLINCCEDAANNFARGHFTVGKNVIETFMDRLRRCVVLCEAIQGFILLHSYGGGTGSGLSALIFENLDIEFSKCPKFEESIFPAPQLATAIVEPYNAILSASKSMDHTDVCMLLDNESSFEICARKLSIPRPSYNNINRIIAQIFSAMTVSIRFGATLNHDLNQLQTNLVPYPRIHFPIVNYSPIINSHRANHESLTVNEITRELFEPNNQLVKCDQRIGKYMSCCIQYRGLITPRQVNVSIYEIKRRTDVNFVDWCPTGFKLGISPMPPVNVPGSELANTDKNCTMFCNTTAVVQLWQRINKKFDLLFLKRAFVHWYVGEGMEEGEFVEARNDINTLEKDYEEVGSHSTESDDANKPSNKGNDNKEKSGSSGGKSVTVMTPKTQSDPTKDAQKSSKKSDDSGGMDKKVASNTTSNQNKISDNSNKPATLQRQNSSGRKSNKSNNDVDGQLVNNNNNNNSHHHHHHHHHHHNSNKHNNNNINNNNNNNSKHNNNDDNKYRIYDNNNDINNYYDEVSYRNFNKKNYR